MADTPQPYRLPGALFPTGELMITPNALQVVGMEQAAVALARHSRGDWGEVDAHDRKANEDALRDGTRLFSVYRSPDGRKFWIITEWDRSLTTILLPEDY